MTRKSHRTHYPPLPAERDPHADMHQPGSPTFDGAAAYEASFDDECDSGDDEMEFDCHLSPDGQCGKAGSEECDWVCPMRDSEFFAGSAAWRKKHGEV